MRISDWSSDVCSSDLNGHTSKHNHAAQYHHSRDRRLKSERRSDDRHRRRGECQRDDRTDGMALQQPCHTALADQRRTYCREGNRAKGFRPYGEKTCHRARRSEEHTSELQSLMRISYAVFCLKKKKHTTTTTENTQYQY